MTWYSVAKCSQLLSAWRHGDVETVARLNQEMQRDLPSFGERLIAGRNRNWIPKIERYLRDRRTYFVVAEAVPTASLPFCTIGDIASSSCKSATRGKNGRVSPLSPFSAVSFHYVPRLATPGKREIGGRNRGRW
jgi:hypothetical protein